MNRTKDHEDLIDLGKASVETKGTPVGFEDTGGSLIPQAGLSDE